MSRLVPDNYMEKVYAGWLGKIIGVRHGANIEGWVYERISKTFGEITKYLNDFKNFAADDDLNGPIFFMRALEDYPSTANITPEEMGLTLLNYVPDGHGFFWWGGYGKFTEHTAYLNLKNGIAAPQSGSIEQNGVVLAEQIGGQIFSDVWGLLIPGRPGLAAEYAGKMASVTHGGNGIYGGMFIAACVAEAFVANDVEDIIKKGLSVIPPECEYARMATEMIDYYKSHSGNWREGFGFIKERFDYKFYPGVCHIIPNAAVVLLSLLYGEGDFSNTINIANMCGWDTDCNVGNVGSIIGVFNGLKGIDTSWITPINDFICTSSVIGSLNIWDIPSLASYTAHLTYRIAGQEPPKEWADILVQKQRCFHFEYPGSTHALRTDADEGQKCQIIVSNTEEIAHTGNRSLKIVVPSYHPGNGIRIFYQTYYGPGDFNDSRYDPDFSPVVYPGQTVDAWVMLPANIGYTPMVSLYIKDRNSQRFFYNERTELTAGKWTHLLYEIPSMFNILIEEVGMELIVTEVDTANDDFSLIFYCDDLHIFGKACYAIDFAHERIEKWSNSHTTVSQMTFLRGNWTLEDGELSGNYCGEPAEAYTGDYYWKDYSFQATLVPKAGDYHNINFRVQGGIRSYAIGLGPNNKVILTKNRNGYKLLCEADFEWLYGRDYIFKVIAERNEYCVYINGEKVLTYKDDDDPYIHGQVGFSNFHGSHTHYKNFSIHGL